MLGHHCSATSGSEVVYSRDLQTRALPKLSMLLRRFKIGLGFEDEGMRDFGMLGTPAPCAPAGLRTLGLERQDAVVPLEKQPAQGAGEAMESAIEDMNRLEEIESVKLEAEDLSAVADSAGELTPFDEELTKSGVIQLDSSSGSSTSDTTSSDESDKELRDGTIIKDYPHYAECVPEGVDFIDTHTKSCICSLLQFKIHGFEVQTPDVRQISSA